MSYTFSIPLFPLGIFPLPYERVHLHIFEPRYRQLLSDSLENDERFGILFTHSCNTEKLGSMVKVKKIVKEYATGESDILVECYGLFILKNYCEQMEGKPYPGGDVVHLASRENFVVSDNLHNGYLDYLKLKDIHDDRPILRLYEITNGLTLEIQDKLKFAKIFSKEKQELFLVNRLKYQTFLLQQETNSKDNFFLN